MNSLTTQNDLATDVGETTAVSWRAPAQMDYEQWAAIGRTFQQLGRSLNWWIGDWLNQGEQRWGEMYTQALEVTGMASETLSKYKSVAARVPASIRHEELSWSHHFAVAYAPDDLRGPLLEIAARYEMNSRDLKEMMRMDGEGLRTLVEGYDEEMGYADFSRHLNQIRLGLPEQGIINGHAHEPEAEPEAEPPATPARVQGRQSAISATPSEREETDEGEPLGEPADDIAGPNFVEPVYIEEVFAFFDEAGTPLTHCLPHEVAWHGLAIRAALDAHGKPVLLWEKTHETQSAEEA